jgi:hypothetical protein
MKKIEYLSPETKVIELKSKAAILSASDPGEAPGGSGEDD